MLLCSVQRFASLGRISKAGRWLVTILAAFLCTRMGGGAVCVCVCCAPIISSYYARMDDEVKLGLINALTNCSSFAIVGHGRVQL